MNILEKADKIVNQRSEEKERMYGPFGETMERMARIQSELIGKPTTARECYLSMVSMKLAREAHAHKEDNLLDAVAYLGALNNYEESEHVTTQVSRGGRSSGKSVLAEYEQLHAELTKYVLTRQRSLEVTSADFSVLNTVNHISSQMLRIVQDLLR